MSAGREAVAVTPIKITIQRILQRPKVNLTVAELTNDGLAHRPDIRCIYHGE